MCKIFISWIIDPRHKSVISMVEDIRHKMMDRNADMIKFLDTCISDNSPMATIVLEEKKEINRKLRVNWNHDFEFEVQKEEYRHMGITKEAVNQWTLNNLHNLLKSLHNHQ